MDIISRQQAIDALKEKVFHNLSDEFYGAMQVLDELPSVQPTQEIIHCKDCKHWNPQLKTANGNGLGSCDFHDVALVTSEGFCYWAEKRGEQK